MPRSLKLYIAGVVVSVQLRSWPRLLLFPPKPGIALDLDSALPASPAET